MLDSRIKRGSVWWIDTEIEYGSHIQGGSRPYVVISNVDANPGANVVTLCPMSARIDHYASHPRIKLKKDGQVMCDQVTTMDIRVLKEFYGQVSETDMQKIDEALMYQLGLSSDTLELARRVGNIETVLLNHLIAD